MLVHPDPGPRIAGARSQGSAARAWHARGVDTYLIFLENPSKPDYPYVPVHCARLTIEQGRVRALAVDGSVIVQWAAGEWERIVFERSDALTTADVQDPWTKRTR